ncbi:hypothetical protein An07g04310 [Aspergillus niger]|uniref:Uncharacterized protein n=2 Tax=Aspergillus niger TaxID=5061 RepID=A2QN40_ASPNC|nr:hypothetical protein An07g04310 [Aspergillus niger]CAK48181.1 hypothetical protein An07g04310 [Aspergillus niger]
MDQDIHGDNKRIWPRQAPLRIAVKLGIRQGQREETCADTSQGQAQPPCSDRMLICSPTGAASFLCRPRDSPLRHCYQTKFCPLSALDIVPIAPWILSSPNTLTGRSPEAPGAHWALKVARSCHYG